jgi:cobalt-zinc-cadmium efflux system outer membrane protein
LKGAMARLLNARRLLDQTLTRAYIASLLADANVAILRASAASLRKEAFIAEKRFKAGDISFSDKNQIEIAADRFELDAESAKTNAISARVAVENLMGVLHPTGEWRAAESLDEVLRELMSAPDGRESPRPDLAAAEASLKKAEADLKFQKAMRFPDPTLLFQYEHAPPDQPNTVGLGFSFPLPLWNRNQGNISATEAARIQAELLLNKSKGQINLEIANARSAYENSMARSRHYREEILPRSAEILKTVTFAYEKGGASLLDLLSAERTDNDVRLATALSVSDAAAAAADLRSALYSQDEGTLRP